MTNLTPDYELLVDKRLRDAEDVPEADTGRNMPASDDFAPGQLYYRIRHAGGQSSEVFLYPVVTVDVFARTVSAAKFAAAAIEAELVGYARGVQVGGRTYAMGKAEAVQPPVEVPDDSRTARWGATYELPLRR